jgi:ABC-type bacteriocin/lantibiotic exporter with double-glycine peptidase domain
VIAIAHRLATLRNFDRVVMLHGGQIQVSIVFVH